MVQNSPRRFDYLFEDLRAAGGVVSEHAGDLDADDDVGYEGHRLDALRQQRVPWYRTTPAVAALAAIGVAVIAILMSGVLLVAGQSRGRGHVQPPVTPTATTTPASSSARASASVPPPPAPTNTASQILVPPPPPPPRPSAAPPPTGGIRAPITRPPMSVAPAPHRAFPRY